MWVFDRPAVLLLLLTVPVGIYLRHFWPGRGGKIVLPFRIWAGTGFHVSARFVALLYAGAALALWIGIAFFVVGIAGPHRVRREQVFVTRGIDIMVVVDQSPTMAAKDFQPDNRFHAAQRVIREFVGKRTNDPIGIVGFGAEASLRVPLTLDYGHLLATMEEMRVLEMGDGTAIGMGVAVAALHLQLSDAPRRVIILLTDGINNAGEILPETAARAAASLDIQVYVVGIGSGEEVEIEVTDPESGRVMRGTVRDGFDEDLLRRVAAIGGGRYFYAGSNGALSAVFSAIDTIERVEQRSLLRTERTPYYQTALLIALICIMVDFLIRRFVARAVL